MDRWIVSFVSSVFLFLFSFFVCFFNIGLVIKENCTLLEEEIPVCKRITKKFSSLKEKKKSLISRLLKINHFILKILFVIVIFFFQFMEAHQFQSPNRNWEWLQPASVCTGPPPIASAQQPEWSFGNRNQIVSLPWLKKKKKCPRASHCP